MLNPSSFIYINGYIETLSKTCNSHYKIELYAKLYTLIKEVSKYIKIVPHTKFTSHIYDILLLRINTWIKQYMYYINNHEYETDNNIMLIKKAIKNTIKNYHDEWLTKHITEDNMNRRNTISTAYFEYTWYERIPRYGLRYALDITHTIIPCEVYLQHGSDNMPNTCAIHSVMILLDSIGVSVDAFSLRTYLDFEIFKQTFNIFDNNNLCSMRSEVSNVLTIFNIIYSYLIPKEILNIIVINSYNISNKRTLADYAKLDINHDIENYDNCKNIASEFIIMDQAAYVDITGNSANEMEYNIKINGHNYLLTGFILNHNRVHFTAYIVANRYNLNSRRMENVEAFKEMPEKTVFEYDDCETQSNKIRVKEDIDTFIINLKERNEIKLEDNRTFIPRIAMSYLYCKLPS